MRDAVGPPLAHGWHPVGLSAGIERGTSNGTRLHGYEIVVWRDGAGGAHVWEDRCPHRGMRLSLGFVRGDHIACLYHGWRYDAAGQCRFIPAHPNLTPPETIRVPVFQAVERLGMIWAAKAGDAEPLPDDRPTSAVRSIAIDCAPELALAYLARLRAASPPVRMLAVPPPAMVVVASEDDDVLVGVQPLEAGACILHIVIAGDHGSMVRKRLSGWAEALRATLEHAQAAERDAP